MNISELRQKASITQAQLAEKIGVRQSAVANWENGLANPSTDKLPAIAATLGCTIDDLFKHERGGDNPNDPCENGNHRQHRRDRIQRRADHSNDDLEEVTQCPEQTSESRGS